MAKFKLGKLTELVALAGLFFAGAASISACGGGGGGPKKHEYITDGSVELKLDYEGRNFFEDGIGQVTVETFIDGDTTHFKNLNGDKKTTLKSRYYGIDTPESTGVIQEYGKQASNFTKSKLQAANENGTIVVSSPFSIAEDGGAGTYERPVADSTGSRFLSLVWINETKKNCDPDELYLLNLYIVQEGLSWAKNLSDVPAFIETFTAAQNQAEQLGLKLWSGEPDPEYNYGEYQTTSLYDVKQELIKQFKGSEDPNPYNGAKVAFTGVVSGYANSTLYVQEHFFFDDEGNPYDPGDINLDDYTPEQIAKFTDEWAGINIFCGMTPLPDYYTTPGTYLRIPGTAQDSDTFGFQVSGVERNFQKPPSDDPKYVNILIPAEENKGDKALKTFSYTSAQLNAMIGKNVPNTQKNYESLFCRTVVQDQLVCESAYLNDAGDELTLYFEGCDFSVYVPINYYGNPTDPLDLWMDVQKVVGKTFEVSGVLGYHKNKKGEYNFQIIICDSADLKCVSPVEGTTANHAYSISDAYLHYNGRIQNVYYYAYGFMTGEATYDHTHDAASNTDQYFVNFTATDGVHSLNVVKANFPATQTALINKATTAAAKQELVDRYMSNFVEGSYVKFRGMPSMENEIISYSDGVMSDAKKPGSSAESAVELKDALELDDVKAATATKYSAIVYLYGVVKEIKRDYDPDATGSNKGRIAFVLEDRDDPTVELLIGNYENEAYTSGAKVNDAVLPTIQEGLFVGKEILLSMRFYMVDDTPVFCYNGCQIERILN